MTHGGEMKKYKVEVRMTYLHHIEVEAESQDDAETKAFESFDLAQAYQGAGECVTIAVEGEVK
jgi:hypothetical protein